MPGLSDPRPRRGLRRLGVALAIACAPSLAAADDDRIRHHAVETDAGEQERGHGKRADQSEDQTALGERAGHRFIECAEVGERHAGVDLLEGGANSSDK